MRSAFRWLMLFCCLLSVSSLANEWKQVRVASERTDVSTWVKPIEGNPLNAFRGQTEVPYPMLTAIAVLADVQNYPEWVFQCHSARLMPEVSDDLAYIHIKGIWPVADRDGVARTAIIQDSATLKTTLHSVAAHGVLEDVEGTVRLPALDNRFILEPLADGWTRITFETFVDPGGMIPAWLANLVATRAPLTTLQKMQVRMAKKRYHLKDKSELPIELPGTENMIFPGGDPL